MNSSSKLNKKNVVNTVNSYILAAITGVIGLLNWFLLRDTVLTLLANSNIDPWAWQAIDNFSFVVFGMIWLGVILFCQYFYKKGLEQKNGLKRFSLVTSIQFVILVLCQLLIIYFGPSIFDVFSTLLIAIQCLIGIALLAYAFRKPRYNLNRSQVDE